MVSDYALHNLTKSLGIGYKIFLHNVEIAIILSKMVQRSVKTCIIPRGWWSLTIDTHSSMHITTYRVSSDQRCTITIHNVADDFFNILWRTQIVNVFFK